MQKLEISDETWGKIVILRLGSFGAIQNCFVKKTEHSHVV